MDVIEYVEKILGIRLFEYQKQLIKELSNMPRGGLQYMYGRRGFIYVVPRDETTKPLQNYQRGLRARMHIVDDFRGWKEKE